MSIEERAAFAGGAGGGSGGSPRQPSGALDRRFELSARGTSARTEVLAGVTTFLTMAYIVLVNPAILGTAGMPIAAVAAATCFAAAFASILMGLVANTPLALAPGMGLNAYFAFTVVQQMRVPWPVALGCVFISGVAFLFLTVTGDTPADCRRDPALSVCRCGWRDRPVHRLYRPEGCWASLLPIRRLSWRWAIFKTPGAGAGAAGAGADRRAERVERARGDADRHRRHHLRGLG